MAAAAPDENGGLKDKFSGDYTNQWSVFARRAQSHMRAHDLIDSLSQASHDKHFLDDANAAPGTRAWSHRSTIAAGQPGELNADEKKEHADFVKKDNRAYDFLMKNVSNEIG
jgi:hypothetical protein